MKNIYLVVLLMGVFFSGCNSEDGNEDTENPEEKGQVTLFDQETKAIAYIDYDDEWTIYTFEGKPVAYLEPNEQVYGFNGKLLGWYSNGVLYDKTYHAVGAKKGIARGGINTVVTYLESLKGIKEVKPFKPVEGDEFTHPVLFDSWSETNLTDFLNEGIK